MILSISSGSRGSRSLQLVAGVGDEHVVFNAHAQILFGNVNARFDGDHHSRLQRAAMVARIVYVEADMMAQAMNEILAERPALAVFPVRVDIVVGDVHQPIFLAAARKMRAGLESCERRVLRAKNDFVDFTLARCEPAARGKRAGDVRGIAGILRSDIEDDDRSEEHTSELQSRLHLVCRLLLEKKKK